MSVSIDAVFDGEVFHPQGHLDLPVNMHYLITIDNAPKSVGPASTADAHGEDFESRSWHIYNDKLRATLEPEHNGKLVAIHLDTGDFEVARSSPRAWKALRKRQPTGQIDVIDIGPVAVDNPLSMRANGMLTRRDK